MTNPAQDVICVSLSEDSLKIVQLKGPFPPKIQNVAAVDIRTVGETELPKVIHNALSGFNVKASTIVSVVPPSMTTTKNIEIPSVNPEEIKSIVSLQAGRHTPFSREEIQIGFVNIGVYKSNYTKVLLVIVNRNVLKKQMSLLEKAGLKVKRVLFAPEGVAGFYTQILTAQNNPNPTGVIDIGKSSTDFVILLKGKPIASRNIPVGRSHLATEGDAAKTKLADELAKTIEAYKSEDIEKVPAEYIITIDDPQSQALQAHLTEKLGWAVGIISYGESMKPVPAAAKRLTTEFPDVSFVDVVGGALKSVDSEVNLIPEEIQLQKSIETQGQQVFFAGVMGFIILLSFSLLFGVKVYFKNAYLEKLTQSTQSHHKEVVSLQNVDTVSKVIQRYINDRMISLDTINELYKKVPNEIYLSNVQMDDRGTVSVQGISDIPSLVYNLGTALKESPLFKSVNIKSTTSKKDRGKDVSAFEITLKLKNAPDDDKDSGKKAEE